ncbi:MAG: four helix bundle protein [Sandaracinaceae bacterium]|nr:four helix bundle protein [Sandaracinaceae bacterium]
MLRVYTLLIHILRKVARLIEEIRKHDPDLARQLRRAFSSSILNVAEGTHADGGNRRLRFRTALGSLEESIAALEIATVLGMVEIDPETQDELQHARAMLIKLSRPRRAA